MPEPRSDPYAVLGLTSAASQRDITLAYRRLVRELHPDASGGDAERLAAVIAAYRLLRTAAKTDRERTRESPSGTAVPVRVHRDDVHRDDTASAARQEPDLRVGPVRYQPGPRRR
ncbi:J domain-containing protein [Amycolatopsis echigonensis]|uniref:J domain-containing protein n=1 Tax=Amycolatopsis echigonensis TaxID=2576905 RepID=A0A8E2B250_9PSEU|nr:J domain-containing protein [Amycolatopsis echigonensis]MBB2499485.1 J domain-containing protein [Amycolatopsis echigonensis]